MNISEFNAAACRVNYVLEPEVITGTEPLLRDFITYQETDLELKIYINKLLFNRSFYGTYFAWPDDVYWFLNGFLEDFQADQIRPHQTAPVKEAVNMILLEDHWGKSLIGTTFMFGVVEHYAKYMLGFRPEQFDFFDENKKSYIKALGSNKRDITISEAIEFIKAGNMPLSHALVEIDNYRGERLGRVGIESDKRWMRFTIAERIRLARNAMLHGEHQGFFDMGCYLSLLYSLFHLYGLHIKSR